MPIPPLKKSSVERALEQLLPELDAIKEGPHNSRDYNLFWKGHRFPPKVVISRADHVPRQATGQEAGPVSHFSQHRCSRCRKLRVRSAQPRERC